MEFFLFALGFLVIAILFTGVAIAFKAPPDSIIWIFVFWPIVVIVIAIAGVAEITTRIIKYFSKK